MIFGKSSADNDTLDLVSSFDNFIKEKYNLNIKFKLSNHEVWNKEIAPLGLTRYGEEKKDILIFTNQIKEEAGEAEETNKNLTRDEIEGMLLLEILSHEAGHYYIFEKSFHNGELDEQSKIQKELRKNIENISLEERDKFVASTTIRGGEDSIQALAVYDNNLENRQEWGAHITGLSIMKDYLDYLQNNKIENKNLKKLNKFFNNLQTFLERDKTGKEIKTFKETIFNYKEKSVGVANILNIS